MPLKKIIEYNGISWHPRKSWDLQRWNSWRCAFKKYTADEKYKIDQRKKQLADKV